MIKNLPDKWVRKAVYDAINNIVVNGETIKCYDYRLTGSNMPKNYILLSTQTNLVNKSNKCEYYWGSSILIDIVTKYKGTTNPGTRLLADDILDKVRELTDDLKLDPSSDLTIFISTQSFPNDIFSKTKTENVFRKLMRLELSIN